MHLTSPNSLRIDADSSTGASSAYKRTASKKVRSLQCSKCYKFRRSCRGEPGESCKFCTRNRAKCSFLDPRPFRCELCNRDYATDAALRGHITLKHLREISCSVDLDVPEAPHITNPPQGNINHTSTSPLQHFEKSKTSTSRLLDLSCGAATSPLERAGSQRRRYFDLEVIMNEDEYL